ncbi:hypothetical protein VCBJG01_0281, partial [Vibrio cholerae BJG-01]
MACWHFRGCWC